MGRQLLHILTLILLTVVANATQGAERHGNIVTWVYDGESFTPVAKVAGGERYTIVHDYLGTPTQAYDSRGDLVWEMLLDVYGGVMECRGDRSLVPFRYQGQYEDAETGLYYNRFRYYSPQMGMYISSDPIGLAGNNPTLYGYVSDVNAWLDVWGLRALWQITPEGTSKTKVIGGRVYSQHKSTGLWWSKDTAGHGGSAFKVYKEKNGKLEWYRDADEYGDFISPQKKHKGPIGKTVCH